MGLVVQEDFSASYHRALGGSRTKNGRTSNGRQHVALALSPLSSHIANVFRTSPTLTRAAALVGCPASRYRILNSSRSISRIELETVEDPESIAPDIFGCRVSDCYVHIEIAFLIREGNQSVLERRILVEAFLEIRRLVALLN